MGPPKPLAKTAMPKVPSLLFDMEIEGGDEEAGQLKSAEVTHAALASIRTLVTPASDTHRQVRGLVDTAVQRGQMACTQLSHLLSTRGFKTEECTTRQPGTASQEWLQSLAHSFLLCARDGELFVVDPIFRDQFEIAQPSQRYSAIMASVPRSFVGTDSQLQQLVKLLCTEMHAAFTSQNASIPPWRSKESLLSKWRMPQALRMPDARLSPHKQRNGVFKTPRPLARKCSQSGGCQAVAAMKRVSSFCRTDSHGALSSASEEGWQQEHLVAPTS